LRLSPSKLSTFLSCGMKYKYKYIDFLPDPSGQAAVNGTAVHSALELLYQLQPEMRTLPRALTFLDHVLNTWPATEEFQPDPDKCQLLVWNLFDIEDPTTVNCRRTEMDLLLDWEKGHQLRGIIDRVDVEDDGYVIVDYKTGKAPSDKDVDEKTLGIKIYAMMGKKAFGTLPVRVKLLWLGTPQVMEIDVTERMVRSVEMKAAAAVEAMEAKEFSTNPGFACTFCRYKELCPDALTSKPRGRRVKK